MKYSCLVPSYNEYPRVLDVLQRLSRVTELEEVICVDDGSADETSRVAASNFPQVKLITHKQNLGKLASVLTGLKQSVGDVIILFDADLQNINPKEISRAINTFEKQKPDCLLLCTASAGFWDSLARILIRIPHAATGCRIIKKDILEKALAQPGLKSYQLESAQNKYLMDNKLSAAYTNISAVNLHKVKKVGLLRGIYEEILMWSQFLSHASFIFNIRQALFFARRKV